MASDERGIFFEITNACNHRCIHCCKYWENNSICRTATKETLDKILGMPKRHLTISGGEPSLVKDKVWYLVEKETAPVTINTNLTNWTEDEIVELTRRGVEFNISIVSLDMEAYRAVTGANTFDKMLRNLDLVDRGSFITMVVDRLNEASVDYTVAILVLMGFYNIMVTPQKPTQDEAIDVPKITQYVQKLHEHYEGIANIMTQGLCDIKYCDHKCNAGIGRFVIDTELNVYPCAPIHKDCLLGTIDTPIEELKENGERFYFSYPKNMREVCKGFIL